MKAAGRIHWGRVVIGAILVEVSLIVTTVPVALVFGPTAFFAVVPPACFAMGFLFAFWVARKVESRFILHGTMVGMIATAIYIGLWLGQSGSIMPAIELYGPFLFILSNGLRILGCVAGAAFAERKRIEAAKTYDETPA